MNTVKTKKAKTSKNKLIRTCSIWRSLEVVGDTPTILILEAYWLGERRFDGFCKATGLLKTVVSDRLKRLINNDCMVKIAYSERPKRYEYKATEKLIDFFPMALVMLHWERKWNKSPNKIKLTLTHTRCGKTSEPFPVCKACKTPLHAADVEWQEGPGVGLMEGSYSSRRRQSAELAKDTRLFDDVSRIIGNRWATLILRSLFTGINQFQEILNDTNIATNILSDRLTDLCEQDIIYKVSLPTDSRRKKYKLTEKGKDIYPILLSLLEWGDKWLPAPDGPPLLLTHKNCGQPLKVELSCSACGDEVRPEATRYKFD